MAEISWKTREIVGFFARPDFLPAGLCGPAKPSKAPPFPEVGTTSGTTGLVTSARSVNREVRLAESEHSDPGEIMPRVHTGPEASVIRREDATALEQAIAGLSDDGQVVLRLRHWEGRGFDEIALEIGKSEAALRKIWYRSLQRLGEIVRSDAALAADGDAALTNSPV